MAGVTFADKDYCAIKLNFLRRQGDAKDDYLGLEIVFVYDMEQGMFLVKGVNSECI